MCQFTKKKRQYHSDLNVKIYQRQQKFLENYKNILC